LQNKLKSSKEEAQHKATQLYFTWRDGSWEAQAEKKKELCENNGTENQVT